MLYLTEKYTHGGPLEQALITMIAIYILKYFCIFWQQVVLTLNCCVVDIKINVSVLFRGVIECVSACVCPSSAVTAICFKQSQER